MSLRRALQLAAVCLGLALGPAAPAAAEDGSGAYRLVGQNAGGDVYQGAATIEPNGTTFRVKWSRPLPLEQRGYAVRLDDVLGVVADDPSADYGIVLYRVRDGHLEGVWRSDGGRSTATLGHENLDGPAGLQGRFIITLGRNPDGSPYGGTVEIKRAGAIYLVDWYTPSLRYIGTGVLMGNIFVVGYGERHRSGVAAYCLQSVRQVKGITGAAADTAVGAEILWRQDAPPVEDPVSQLARLRERGTVDCGAPISSRAPAPERLIVTSR
ncbi:hypothetical protein [Dongia sp.]|uniref:hypothetical protein n=1 Tax=Dongia sp. TaxID=1977262 RepID=UPI0037504306